MLNAPDRFFKAHQITAFFTSLTEGGSALEQSEVGISSLMDTWILLRQYRKQRRTQSRHMGLEIARHGSFEPDQEFCVYRPRH